MQKRYSLLIVLAITASARSQTFQWAKKASSGVNGDAYGFNVALDAYGNSYVAGMYADVCVFDGGITVTSAGSKDIYIAKYTTNGNLLWVKSIGGAGEDSGTDIDVDASGNVYITGHFSSTVDFDPGAAVYNLTSNAYTDIYIAKYDADGNFQWTAGGGSQDYDYSNALAIDDAGNAYITGRFAYTLALTGPGSSASTTWGGGNYFDVFIAKCDANGSWVWAASAGGQGGDVGYGIAVDGTGNIYATGQYTEYGEPAWFGSNALTGSGMFVAKYSNAGTSVWVVKANGYETYGSDIDVDINGNVYASGQFNTTVTFDNYPNCPSNATTVVNYVTPQVQNHCLVKYDGSGNLQFAQTLGNVGSFWGNGISVNYSDEIFITGTFAGTTIVGGVQVTSSGFDNVFIAKFNPAGGLIWVTKAKGSYYHVAGGSGNEAGSVYVTGHFAYYASFGEFALTGACGQFCNFTMFITKLNDFLHTGVINASVCTGETISVPYTVTGTSLLPGNIFTAQLSDASGSFVNPVNIGTLNSADANGTITAIIPQNTATGTTYRIRAIASSPLTLGEDNGANITIKAAPLAEAGTDKNICTGMSATLTATATGGTSPYSYLWSNGATTASITISPAATNTYTVTVSESNGCHSKDSAMVIVSNPVADAGSDITIVEGQGAQIGTAPEIALIYSWIPSTGLSDPNISNPIANPASAVTYTLTVTTEQGCSAADNMIVNVLPQSTISSGAASQFAILAGGNITATNLVYAYQKVGAVGNISSLINSATLLTNNSGNVPDALNNFTLLLNSLNGLQGIPISSNLYGQSLSPGFYSIDSDAQISGPIELTGDENSIYIFKLENGGYKKDFIVKSGSVINGIVKPQNIYWIADDVVLESEIFFSGIILATGNIDCYGGNYGVSALIAEKDINFNGIDLIIYSQNYLFDNPDIPFSDCFGLTENALILNQNTYENIYFADDNDYSNPINLLNPTTGFKIANLAPCTSYKMRYNIYAMGNVPPAAFDAITLQITLPPGLAVANDPQFSSAPYVATADFSAPTAPTFSIQAGAWEKNTALTLDFTITTSGCNNMPIYVPTDDPHSTLFSEQKCGFTTFHFKNEIFINETKMAVKTMTYAGVENEPLILSTGDLSELVFEVQNTSAPGGNINRVSLMPTPDPTMQILGYYLIHSGPTGPIPVQNVNEYDASNYQYYHPWTNPQQIDFLSTDFIQVFGSAYFPAGEKFYIHFVFKIPYNLASENCGESPGGIWEFSYGCQNSDCGEHKIQNTSINLYTVTPGLSASPIPNVDLPFCPNGSLEVGFTYTNALNPQAIGVPVGSAKATNLVLYAYLLEGDGTLDNFKINDIPLPIASPFFTSSIINQEGKNYNVYKLDFNGLAVDQDYLWNYFGTNTLADMDGDGFIDDLNDGSSFTIKATFYTPNTCPDFQSCESDIHYYPAIEAKFNNQCFSLPPCSLSARCSSTCDFDYYCPNASYRYERSRNSQGTLKITDPQPPAPDINEGEFTVEICPGRYYEQWAPGGANGFNFDCPDGFHRIKIELPPGMTYVPEPITVDLSNPYNPQDFITQTVQVQDVPGTPHYLYLNFGKLPLKELPSVNTSFIIPCFSLKLNFSCTGLNSDPLSCTSPVGEWEWFGGYMPIASDLEFICDGNSITCNTCYSELACQDNIFMAHCDNPCCSRFGTERNYFDENEEPVYNFFFGRKNKGFNNPVDYINYCESMHAPVEVAAKFSKDSVYPGDVVEVIAKGHFTPTGIPGQTVTGDQFTSMGVEINYMQILSAPFNFNLVSGTLKITNCNGITQTFQSNQFNFIKGMETIDGNVMVYGRMHIDISQMTDPADFFSDPNCSYLIEADVTLVFNETGLNKGRYSIVPTVDFCGINNGGLEKSCDTQGTNFELLVPHLYPTPVSSTVICCGNYDFKYRLIQYPAIPPDEGDDFPIEFRAFAALDDHFEITIPNGYTPIDNNSDYTVDFVSNINAYDQNGSDNNFFFQGTPTIPYTAVIYAGNFDQTTRVLTLDGLNNITSCWPLIDNKGYNVGPDLYPSYYDIVIHTKVDCNAPEYSVFHVEGGVTKKINSDNYQLHSSISTDVVIRHVIPDLVIMAPLGSEMGYNNSMTFEFTMCNNECNANASWISFENADVVNPAVIFQKLEDVSTGQPVNIPKKDYSAGSGGIINSALFNLGNMPGDNSCRIYKLTVSLTDGGCIQTGPNEVEDNIKVLFGNECDGDIINEPSEASCPDQIRETQFNFNRYRSDLGLSFSTTDPIPVIPVDICDGQLTYNLVLSSSDLGTIYDPYFNIDVLPSGLAIDNINFTYKGSSFPTSIPSSPPYQFNINAYFSEINDAGLPGLSNAPDNIINISVVLNTSCEYTGDKVIYSAGGKQNCLTPLTTPTLAAAGTPPIQGFIPYDALQVSVQNPPGLICNNQSTLIVNITNSGSDATQHNNILKITVPTVSGLVVDATGFSQSGNDYTTTLPDLNPQGSIQKSIMFYLTGSTIDCSNLALSVSVYASQTVECQQPPPCENEKVYGPFSATLNYCCDCDGNPLTANQQITNVDCNGNNNGAIQLAPSGGTAPYTYLWSNGANTLSVSGLDGGNYSVTITDATNNCSAEFSYIISEPLPLTTIIDAIADVECYGGSTGSATVTATGGPTDYTYLWSNGQTTETATGLSAGTYSVTVTDANGCTSTASASITQPTELSATISSQTNVTCNNASTGSATITASGGTTPYTFSWSDGQITETAVNLSAGSYSATVTDNSLCTQTTTIIINEPSNISITSAQTNVSCNGGNDGTVDAYVSGGTAPYTYSWSNGASTSSVSGLTAGTYTATITDANGCTSSVSVEISEPSAITLSDSKNNVTCNGSNDGSATVTASGGVPGYLYNWSNGGSTTTITNLSPGSYSVTVTDANGCTQISSITIAEPSPLTLAGSKQNVTCNGGSDGSFNAVPGGGTTGYTYLWSTGATTQNITGLPAGNYTLTVTDANGCTVSATEDINQPPLLVVSAIGSNNVSCNAGSDGNIIVAVYGGISPYNYLWSNGNNTYQIYGITAGTYTITVTDDNSCVTAASVTITEPPAIIINLNKTDVSCNGANDGSANAIAAGGTSPYTFQWSNGQTGSSVSGLSAGTYMVTVTDANNCDKSGTIVISEPDALVLEPYPPTSITDVICYGDNDGAIEPVVAGGITPYTFLWSNGETSQNIYNLTAGWYYGTVTDANGCTGTHSFFIFEPTPLVIDNFTTVSPPCNGGNYGSIQVFVSGGNPSYTYLWSNGGTASQISNLVAGSYSVTVTDWNGCTISGSEDIPQPDELILTASVSHVTCNFGDYSSMDGAIDLTVTGGTTPFSFNWSNYSTTEDITGLSAGTYTVIVNDANGCSKTTSATITQPPPFTINLSSANVTCVGFNDGMASVSPAGGTPPYTYYWNTGATSASLSGLASGTYTITVTDANDCELVNQFNITVTNPIPHAAFEISSLLTCTGQQINFYNFSTPNQTYFWQFGDGSSGTATNPSYTYTSPGIYIVSLTVSNVCGQDAITHTVNIIPSTPDYNNNCCSEAAAIFNPGGTLNVLNDFTISNQQYLFNFTNNLCVNGNVIIEGTLLFTGSQGTVYSLADLTIQFGLEGKMVIDLGITVNAQNCIFTGLDICNTMWQGMEVYGKPTEFQNSGKMGKIDLAGCTVRRAHVGIMAGRRNFIAQYGGAIVNVNGCTFYKNGIAVLFDSYGKKNTSSIRNSLFNGTVLPDPGYQGGVYKNPISPFNNSLTTLSGLPKYHVYIFRTHKVTFTGNTLQLAETGIESFEGRLNVGGLNNSDINFFTNLRFGIKFNSYAGQLSGAAFVINNRFINPLGSSMATGLRVYNGGFSSIDKNNFINDLSNSQGKYRGGIYMENSGSFYITDNTFLKIMDAAAVNNSGKLGGILVDLDPLNKDVGNEFTNCYRAVSAWQNNRTLQINCNTTINSFANLYNYNFKTFDQMANQGKPACPNPPCPSYLVGSQNYAIQARNPAGNKFDKGSAPIRKQLFHNCTGIPPCSFSPYWYIYYHHSTSDICGDCVIPVPVGQVIPKDAKVKYYMNLNPCDICFECQNLPYLDSTKNEITALESQAFWLSATLDNGKTQQLLSAINSNMSPGNLKNLLVANSPLSDEVLLALINKAVNSSMPAGIVKEILTPNMPVSGTVYNQMIPLLNKLPEGIKKQLESMQTENATVTTVVTLERSIEAIQNDRQIALNGLALRWLEEDKEDSLIYLLQQENTYETNAILFGHYLSQGNLSAATSALNAMIPTTQAEQDYVDLQTMLLQLAMDSLTIFDLDSAQIAYVHFLAYHLPESQATTAAKAILGLLFGEDFDIVFPTEPTAKMANQQAADEQFDPSASSGSAYGLVVRHYPEPSGNVVYLECFVPSEANGAILKIHSIAGQIQTEIKLSEGTQLLEINTTGWSSGMYFYSITTGNGDLLIGKMTKANQE